MKQILCLPNEPWSASPGRTQHLLSRLKDVDILYFSPAGGRSGRTAAREKGRVRSNVTVCTLPAPLFQGKEGSLRFELELRRACRFLESRMAAHRFRRPLLWTTNPKHVHLVDELEFDGLVYDCDRVWEDLPRQWETSLAAAADVVFAASPQLAEELSPYSANVTLLPNGVNYPLFAAEEGLSRRNVLPRISGPVLGWAGTIRPEVDLSPIHYAALARPGWTFVLVGPLVGNRLLPRLRRMPNVVLPGEQPLAQVPDWLYRCDVLLDLLREDQPEDMISLRLYEYLSTGKPVVSMMWDDQVELLPDVVYGAYSPEEFLTLCEHALEEVPGFVSQRRQAYGRAASWGKRAEKLSQILAVTGLL